MQEQWAKISENLKKMLDSGVFKVWIAPLHATVGVDSLQLTAPSAFVAHWLEHKMLPALQQAAAPVLGLDPAAIAVKVGVATDRRAREAGESKYTLKKMLKLALKGMECGRRKPERTSRSDDAVIAEVLHA